MKATYRITATEDYETMIYKYIVIELESERIGYVEMFVALDEDYDMTDAFIKSIEINAEHRNHGYGTEIIKALAAEYESIYICPDNDDAERLYKRLGEETDAPEAFESELDNYDTMYYIEG